MARRRVLERLEHMMDAVIAIERLTAGKTLEEYCANPDLAASVERYLERLSEASRHIPEALKQDRPHVDWRGVADVGNVLRHAYDQVVDPRVWEIVEIDLPPIKTAVDDMMREVDRGDGD